MAYAHHLSRIDEMAGKFLQMPFHGLPSLPLPPPPPLSSSSSSVPSPSEPSVQLQHVQEDLKVLQKIVRRIQAVLQDAEKMEVLDASSSVMKLWLRELKGVAYDAEDVLDEYEYELLRVQVEARTIQGDHEAADPLPCKRKYKEACESAVTPIPLLDASSFGEMAGKIGRIRGRFEQLLKDHAALHLLKEGNAGGRGGPHGRGVADRPPSSHIVDEPKIYGRREDLEKVIHRLLHSDECKESNLSVLPILGMGGVGKTTLVQHVYNDRRICDRFQMKGWVCVSDDFRVQKLTANIIESLTKCVCHQQEFSVLQEKLKESISLDGQKRFLLVLDDVWNENPRLWESLQKPLRYGLQGSAVITTTRSEAVAKIMQTVPFHRLDCLTIDDCWAVFRQSAFVDRDPDACPELKEVGLQIVRRCGGLPLAAKSMGGLLSYESEVAVWEEVLESDVWDLGGDQGAEEIIPALRLSYLHLSSHLKPCFLYASIFPKDFKFEKDDMVLLWMAQGFLQCRGGGIKQGAVEDFGRKCFEELVQRSFFQRHSGLPGDEGGRHFVMHDLIHDLAQQISGGECFQYMCRDGIPSLPLPDRVQHVSVIHGRVADVGKALCSALRAPLRTIILIDTTREIEKFLKQLRPALKFLRALDLGRSEFSWRGFLRSTVELPDSIGDLKHLRYLSLDSTGIRRLPDSICKLYNLQTLSLRCCCWLRCLPEDVKNLCNLRHLKIENSALDFLPSGFGRLTRLRTLDAFRVNPAFSSSQHPNDHDEVGMGLLKDLIHLGGAIRIAELKNVMDAEDARLADLRSKENIKELDLNWYSYNLFDHRVPAALPTVQTQVLENLQPPDRFQVLLREAAVQTRVLEYLQPSDRLQVLRIYYYGGFSFPSWMGDGLTSRSSLSRLVRVEIYGCIRCTSLPALGQLPSLKHLRIEGMDMLEAVGSEFYGLVNITAFPALEELVFIRMRKWVTWDDHQMAAERGRVAFACLRRLQLIDCWVLKSMVPLFLLPALEELEIYDCRELVAIQLGSTCSSSSSTGCPASSVNIGGPPPPLKKMAIAGCPGARFLPEDDEHLSLPPSLREIHMIDTPLLVEWCERGGEGRRHAHIPNAKIWRTVVGGKVLSTSDPTREEGGELRLYPSAPSGVFVPPSSVASLRVRRQDDDRGDGA